MDKNRHLLFMRKVLRDIFSDPLLASELKFKGGTAAMFFYGLPRFSTDLDFNMVHLSKQQEIFERLLIIVKKYGNVHDSANKQFGPIVVLDYGVGERKLKIEVSNRRFDNHYELHDISSVLIPVMCKADMFAHKLCAMRERRAPRDVFDVWYFLSQGWEINPNIIKERTGLDVPCFLSGCIDSLKGISPASMMMEIGELLDGSLKEQVRSGLVEDCRALLNDYVSFPLIKECEPLKHTSLLFKNENLIDFFIKEHIDPSAVSSSCLEELLSGRDVVIKNRKGVGISVFLSQDGSVRKKNGLSI